MNHNASLAAGLGLLLAAALGWLLLRHDDAPAEAAGGGEASAVATADPPTAAPGPDRAAGAMAPAGAAAMLVLPPPPVLDAAGPDPAHGGTIRGQLASRQRPHVKLADLEVMATRTWLDTVLPPSVGEPAEPLPELQGVRTRTDGEGRFALRVAAATDELFLLLGRGTDWHEVRKLPFVPRAGAVLDLGVLWLDDRGCIAGRAVDATGEPCAGVEVRAVDAPLLDVTLDSNDLRQARNDGLRHFRVDGLLDGQSLPPWIVQRDRLLPFPRARTGADGRFLLHGVRPGRHELLLHDAAAHGGATDVLVRSGETTQVGGLRLEDGRTLEAEVFTDDGKPYVGGRLAALAAGYRSSPPPATVSAHGRVRLEGLPPADAYVLLFQLPQGGPFRRVGTVEASPVMGVQMLRIERPQACTVQVVDAAGVPVRDATLQVFARGDLLRPTDVELPAALQPQPLGGGRFRTLLFHQVVAVAGARDCAPAIAALPAAHDTIALPPAVPVRVHARDADGAPVADACIVAHLLSPAGGPAANLRTDLLAAPRAVLGRTDARGELRVPNLPPTALALCAEHADYARAVAPVTVPAADQVFELELRAAASLRGLMTMSHRPVGAGYRVQAVAGWPDGHPLAGNPFLRPHHGLTATDGTFALHDFPVGVWLVQALLPRSSDVEDRQPEARRFLPELVQFAAGQQRWLELEVSRPLGAETNLVGQVSFDGIGVDRAVVRLRPLLPEAEQRRLDRIPDPRLRQMLLAREHPERMTADPWSQRATTDPQGSFAFEELAAGDYELRVDVPFDGQYAPLTTRLLPVGRPVDGQPAARCTDVRIDVATGAAQLWFFGTGAEPLAGRVVRLRQLTAQGTESATFTGLTDPRGGLFCERLPAGTWAVELVHGEPLVDPQLEITARTTTNATYAPVR